MGAAQLMGIIQLQPINSWCKVQLPSKEIFLTEQAEKLSD